MPTRTPWPQMVGATVFVMVAPAAAVGALSAVGIIDSLWAALLSSAVLALGCCSAGSAYWRHHRGGDVLFSDLLPWGWWKRRRMEGRLARADVLLAEAGSADPDRKSVLLRELGAALDAEEPYVDGHSRRVARYAEMIARKLQLPGDRIELAASGAAIHDIGKLRIPSEIVHKQGRLSEAEYEVMKHHAAEGGRMAETLGGPTLGAVVRAHHEHFDGSGYPDHSSGEAIPLEARIITVADTFDAITSARAYKQGRPHAEALRILDEEAGAQLDPVVVRAFVSCYSDRRGAALWAGAASLPRQVAERLSIAPGEIGGALAGMLAASLVVAAGAVAATTLPETSEPETAAAGATRTAPPAPTPARTAPPAASRTSSATPRPAPTGVPTASPPARPTPAMAASASPRPSPAPAPTATVTASPSPSPSPSPEAEWPLDPLPSWPSSPEPVPTSGAPSPEPTPEPSPTPTPTPSRTPEATATPPETATPTSAPAPPHSAEDCKDGGWEDLGYPNQGQCIADADPTPPG